LGEGEKKKKERNEPVIKGDILHTTEKAAVEAKLSEGGQVGEDAKKGLKREGASALKRGRAARTKKNKKKMTRSYKGKGGSP